MMGILSWPEIEGVQSGARSLAASLRAMRNGGVLWRGHVSSSAVATSVALLALTLSRTGRRSGLLRGGVHWLRRTAGAKGGWGDVPGGPATLHATALVWAAATALQDQLPDACAVRQTAHDWLRMRVRTGRPRDLAAELQADFGCDRTFSVPILAACAAAGCFGGDRQAWARVPQLPFELAVLPRSLFRRMGLPVVSYALPALIAVGWSRLRCGPATHPAIDAVRTALGRPVLRRLASGQPAGGGYLCAVPLTGFAALCLSAAGLHKHPVVQRAGDFLARHVRPDGSWPVVPDLATWLTTLTVNAFQIPGGAAALTRVECARLSTALTALQGSVRDPCTGAPAGGWSWTDLSGGLADADDTAGALLALAGLEEVTGRHKEPAGKGLQWLMRLQNRDGGMPTFCRGWGHLPFDRSCEDITAHAVRAWCCWTARGKTRALRGMDTAVKSAVRFLLDRQHPAGAWSALWFGNPERPGDPNRIYGTARVLTALAALPVHSGKALASACRRGLDRLLQDQHADGGWGSGAASTAEETAVATESLAVCGGEHAGRAARAGVRWILERLGDREAMHPAPLGLYFSRLQYAEQIYPHAFALAALNRVWSRWGPHARSGALDREKA